MKNKPLGLDLGASSIKAVWLKEEKNHVVLAAAVAAPTPSKGMFSESPLDQEEMAQAIKRVLQEAKIEAKSVTIALPENRVYTKVLEMPVLSDKELASAIYWEAEQYIPVPLENITLDWKVLKKPEKMDQNTKMQVFLVGAPTALITKYQKVLAMAGLSVSFVETEILSAIRAIMYPYTHIQHVTFPNTIIVNIGATSTSLAIVKDNIIVFTYSVAVGGSAISRAIAADFGFSVAQAEEYKKVYGVSQNTFGGKIGEATKPVLLSIASEVKKAIAFYKEKYKNDQPIQQLLLCGGTAKLPEIDLFFAQNTEIETAMANPWHILGNQEIPKELLNNATDYTIAVGLAIRDYA